jgi:hypothetical protein
MGQVEAEEVIELDLQAGDSASGYRADLRLLPATTVRVELMLLRPQPILTLTRLDEG